MQKWLYYKKKTCRKPTNRKTISIHRTKYTKWFPLCYFRCQVRFLHLVVVVEQPQSRCAVLIPIDAHHGLGGSAQRVLQVALPRFILAAEHSAGGRRHLVWHHHHQSFTADTTGRDSRKPRGEPQAVSHQPPVSLLHEVCTYCYTPLGNTKAVHNTTFSEGHLLQFIFIVW